MISKYTKPLVIFLTGIAIAGFLIQLFLPDTYFVAQEQMRDWVLNFSPYDMYAFIALQAGQVIVAPVSHYLVGLLGGALYGAWQGAGLNWVGRMIGHICTYWIGRTVGRKFVSWVFDESDFHAYQRFINGTKDTIHLRLLILFIIFFLPLFPDDEISYLIGLAAFPFRFYLPMVALGNIGGSLGLAYIGAGIDTKDIMFWILFFAVLFLAMLLIFAVKQLSKSSE